MCSDRARQPLFFEHICRRWSSNRYGKCSQERLRRGTVTSAMRRAAHPSGCARCGAGAGCLAIRYQSRLPTLAAPTWGRFIVWEFGELDRARLDAHLVACFDLTPCVHVNLERQHSRKLSTSTFALGSSLHGQEMPTSSHAMI